MQVKSVTKESLMSKFVKAALVAATFALGASAVQIGTANFYNPTATTAILDALPSALAEAGVTSVAELVGKLSIEK